MTLRHTTSPNRYAGVHLTSGGAVSRDPREVVASPEAQQQVAVLRRLLAHGRHDPQATVSSGGTGSAT